MTATKDASAVRGVGGAHAHSPWSTDDDTSSAFSDAMTASFDGGAGFGAGPMDSFAPFAVAGLPANAMANRSIAAAADTASLADPSVNAMAAAFGAMKGGALSVLDTQL